MKFHENYDIYKKTEFKIQISSHITSEKNVKIDRRRRKRAKARTGGTEKGLRINYANRLNPPLPKNKQNSWLGHSSKLVLQFCGEEIS